MQRGVKLEQRKVEKNKQGGFYKVSLRKTKRTSNVLGVRTKTKANYILHNILLSHNTFSDPGFWEVLCSSLFHFLCCGDPSGLCMPHTKHNIFWDLVKILFSTNFKPSFDFIRPLLHIFRQCLLLIHWIKAQDSSFIQRYLQVKSSITFFSALFVPQKIKPDCTLLPQVFPVSTFLKLHKSTIPFGAGIPILPFQIYLRLSSFAPQVLHKFFT